MSTIARDTFPRAPLIGAAGLVGLALVCAVLGRLAGPAPQQVEKPVAQRDLMFADRADGAIVITEVGQTAPLTIVTGQAGFMRGSLRALARERRLDKLHANAPVRLSAWPDGRLTLEDTSDGERIELEAFGPDNEAVYARLLALRENAP